MYKAVVFDMDGVIIDSEPLWEKAEKLFIEGFGMDYNPEYRDKIVGLNQNDSANLIKNSFDLEISVDNIINQRIEILTELYEKELKLIDGILKIINECDPTIGELAWVIDIYNKYVD